MTLATVGEWSAGGRVRVASDCRPAGAAGGDFYRLVDRGGGRVLVFMGDVAGKGPTAAPVVARLAPEVDRLAAEGLAPAALLARLNDRLAPEGEDGLFVTASCLELDLVAGRMRVANAGHVPTFLRLPGGATIVAGEPSGPPLGTFPGQRYEEEERALPDGATILLVTDGVSDAFGHAGDTLGFTTLATVLGSIRGGIDEIRRIVAEVSAAMRAHEDDATVLVLQTAIAQPAAAAAPTLPLPEARAAWALAGSTPQA
jgi:serine phosphatase RsbU (regulator of sigma subunit)